MRRGYQRRTKTSGLNKEEGSANDAMQLMIDPEMTILAMQQSVHNFGSEIGRLVAIQLLSHEVRQLCGDRHERLEGRQASRHGSQRGVITIAGQKVGIERPRVRSHSGSEVKLSLYESLQSEDAMPEAVLRRLIRGVSCRDYEGVVDLATEGFGVKRASVSRAFVKASARELRALAERRFEGVRFAAIFIDGVDFDGEMMIVVMGLEKDGSKRVLGLRQGATENAMVVRSLIEELRERGLCCDHPTLFVLDGSKALRKAVVDIWGVNAVIQRCQVHKKRNVLAHVPDRHRDDVCRRLNEAYTHTEADKALGSLKTTVKWLRNINPDAASSLEEGLEETITVIRLGIDAELAVHLRSTNPIESAFDRVRKMGARVKRWRGGDMRRRWCAAALLEAEKKFRRLKGYRHMPQLIRALDRLSATSTLAHRRSLRRKCVVDRSRLSQFQLRKGHPPRCSAPAKASGEHHA